MGTSLSSGSRGAGVGDMAELAVMRDGKPLKIRATIAERVQRARLK
jgi:hypothetical protein